MSSHLIGKEIGEGNMGKKSNQDVGYGDWREERQWGSEGK
jgi:hypothetical protein